MALKLSLRERTYTPQWDGNRARPAAEQIRIHYHLMSVEDFFLVQEEMQINLMGDQTLATEDLAAMRKRYDVMKHVVTKYVVAWDNVDLDGAVVTSEMVLKALHPGQMGFLAEVYAAVLNASTGDTEQAGNSNAPSEPASEGSGSLAATAGETDSTKSATAGDAT